MSHYAAYSLKTIRNPEVLLAALALLGYGASKVSVHATPVTLIDYYGKPFAQQASIVVHNKGETRSSSYAYMDHGFSRNTDGTYSVMADNHLPFYVDYKGKRMTFVEGIEAAYGTVNRDKAITTVLTRTIPGLKARRIIPTNATAVKRTVGTETRIVVEY